jgi:hypothetical protein
MSAQLKREAWATFWPDAEPLLRNHRAEVDPEAMSAPFEMNVPLAEMLDACGALVIFTAREGPLASLVGYCIWTLGPSLESATLCATQGPWYVRPDRRMSPIGLRLFTRSLGALRELGVQRALPHHWATPDGERLGAYFARLGAKRIETTYSLMLEK